MTQAEMDALAQGSEDFRYLPCIRSVSRASLFGILESVRAKIHDWSSMKANGSEARASLPVSRSIIRKAKSNLHALIAAGVGLATLYVVSRVAREPALQLVGIVGAVAAAKKTFEYLEQDRCE